MQVKKLDSITFSEIMEFYPNHNESVYEELKETCHSGCIIPFVGAGLSVFCGYQGWSDVLKELVKYIYDRDIQADIEKMISDGELLQAAQGIHDHYPRMLKELQKIIDYDKIKNCDDNKLYASAAYVLPYLFDRNFVMTTNFDRVLEEVYDKCHIKFGNIITPNNPDLLTQSRQSNPHCLFKLHGDIGPEIHDIGQLIITQTQYDKAYTNNGPLMQELSQWFQSKRLLFLGCSLAKDRTMEVLQQVTSKNPGLNHYAILECRPDDISQRCIEMGDLGISAIYYPYEKHEAVRIILERLLEDINYAAYEELNRYTQKSVSVPKSANRFMYNSDYVAFVGRGKELVQLQEFCQAPEQISWWAVTGPGGIGKSRLIYEFTNTQKADGWKICWLKHSDYDNLIHWTLPVDRCIVVADDVQAHLQAIGNWIVSVSARLRSEKLRIILLERDGRNLNSAKWAELLQSDFPYDDTISSICYCSDFLNLAPLSDDELKAIMTDFAKASAKPLTNSEHADWLLQTLKKIDGELQRPIYALAITDAWCSGKDPVHWNKEQVLDALLTHELKFYYERLRSLSTDKISKETRSELENLLARSCTIPFLPLDQITDDDCPKLCKRAEKLEMSFHELLRQIGIVHKVEVIYIKNDQSENQVTQKDFIEAVILDCPDLVKEYLVLRQAFNRNKLNLLFPEDWDNSPMQLFFLLQVLLDYPEMLDGKSQFWATFFAGNPKTESVAQLYGNLLFNTTVQLPKMAKHTIDWLEKLHNIFHTNEDIAVLYAMGLVNLVTEQTLEECTHSVDKLRMLHEQFPISKDLAIKYAKGLFNLSAKQTLEECTHCIDKLGLLHKQFPTSEELTVMYAMGLYNLASMQTLEERAHSVDKLRMLHEQFHTNEELAAVYAKGLFNLSIKQALEERAHSVDKLRLLHEQFSTSELLAVEYAKSLVNLSVEQTLEERAHSVDKQSMLHEQFLTSEKLTVMYAMGLGNLAAEQTLEERVHSIDKQSMLHEQFPTSERLAVVYATGLFSLAIEQTMEESAHSVDKLGLLYEQFHTSEELAAVYAKGLVNLTLKQTLEGCTHSVDKLRLLHEQFPTSEELTVMYAMGLYNLASMQTLEESVHSFDKLELLYEQFHTSEHLAVGYATGLVNLAVKQTLEESAHSIDKLRMLHEQFPTSEELTVMYAKGVFNLSTKQILEELAHSVDKLRLLHEQFPASKDLATEYAKGLVNLAVKQTLEESAHSIDKLRLLHEQFPTSEELTVMYAKGVFNLSTEQILEERAHSVDKLRLLHEQFPTSEELAVMYAKGVFNLSSKQILEEHAHSVDKLRMLYEQFPASKDLAIEYATGLFYLSTEQTLEESARSVDKLGMLYEQFHTSEELAAVYAIGLVNLSAEQALEERAHSVGKLRMLHEQFPTSEKLTVVYATGLANLSEVQALEECAHSVGELRLLHEQFLTSEKLAVEYATGLANLSEMQALKECAHSVGKLRLLHEQFPTSEELAVAYAMGLGNLSFKGIDIQKSITQAKKLIMKYCRSAEMQLSFAKIMFNLTLKQEPEALHQTVTQLREFLLAYPDVNQRFQTVLDTYLSAHPEHVERYTALRV